MPCHRDLAAIGRELGQDVGEIESWAAELETGIETLWNAELGCYAAYDLRSERFADSLGSGAFLAWYCGIDNAEMESRLMQIWDAVTYGIPSSDPAAPSFDSRRYWRGPSWPVVNSLIAMGFAETGRLDDAERLRRETRALIRNGGFYEYFDPLDGHPCGGADFTWTAAVWLAWASPSAGEN